MLPEFNIPRSDPATTMRKGTEMEELKNMIRILTLETDGLLQ